MFQSDVISDLALYNLISQSRKDVEVVDEKSGQKTRMGLPTEVSNMGSGDQRYKVTARTGMIQFQSLLLLKGTDGMK